MKVLYGTTNPAKLESMKRITESIGIELIGLNDLKLPLPKVEENGRSPLENAEIKAKAYYKAFSMPVFSCDSGLYFDNLEDSLQPGTHTRRVNGKELTDEEMIQYYSDLAGRHQNRLVGRYRNAIYFILDETTCFSCMDESLMTEPFLLVSRPHHKRAAGFPLDSLSVDQSAIELGFKAFFEKALSRPEGICRMDAGRRKPII